MFPSETIERMETVITALAKNERDQRETGLATGAAETGYALKDANKVLEKLKETRSALKLPVYKSVRNKADLTEEERTALTDNDPVAGTEFREMATLFVQMHEFVCDVAQALALREIRLESHAPAPAAKPDPHAPAQPPDWWPYEWPKETVRIMNARAQALYDNTRAFTRPLGW